MEICHYCKFILGKAEKAQTLIELCVAFLSCSLLLNTLAYN